MLRPFPSSMLRLKSSVRGTLRAWGWDLHRYSPRTSSSAALRQMLATHKVSLVLDVGASQGEYGRWLRDAGYHGRIVSFEPLPEAYAGLQSAAQADPLWTVAPRMALGNQDGTLTVNIAANLVSSSALPMLESHRTAAPQSLYVGAQVVPVARIDTVAPDFIRADDNVFLKADVQGFEDRVLDGATHVLPKICGLQLELSLVPLYEGQELFWTLVERLRGDGYQLWGLIPGFVNPSTGRLLQTDGIFFRAGNPRLPPSASAAEKIP